jgi:hypothetical protein
MQITCFVRIEASIIKHHHDVQQIASCISFTRALIIIRHHHDVHEIACFYFY